MANPQSSKGNPASHRMGNVKLKERRARSWKRGQDRKAARVSAQREREIDNKSRRESGLPTLWEMAKAERYARRHPVEN